MFLDGLQLLMQLRHAEDQKAPLVITIIKPNKFIRYRELDTEEDKWITYYRKGLFRCNAKKQKQK